MALPFTQGAMEGLARAKARPRILPVSYPWWHLGIGLAIVALIAILAGGIGSVSIPPLSVLQIVLDKLPFFEIPGLPQSWKVIIWQLRFPRIVLAALVGAALAISGVTYQGLFRNPLAEPYLLGTAAGAGLGATVVLTSQLPVYVHGLSLLLLAAFAGALLAVTVVYTVAKQSDGLSTTTLILAGVAISSLAGALASLLMIRASPDVRPLLAWLLGGFGSAHWQQTWIVLPYLVPGALVMMAHGRILNLLQLDEHEATQLGVNVERSKGLLIAAASLATAASVSVSGLIGFVGLIAPHTVRLVWGPDHRFLLPMSMVVGAGFLILADLVARTVANPSELPVGVVTAFCGAPFFLYLLRKGRRPIA